MSVTHSTGRSRPRSGRTAALLVAFLPLLAACTGSDPGLQPGDEPESGGPVAFTADHRVVQNAGMRAHAGQTVVFGAATVRNHGTKPATLTAASLEGTPTGDGAARLATVRVVDVTDGGDLVGAAVWPFEDYGKRSVPLEGYTLKPGDEAELLFIVDVQRTGVRYWPRTSVRYDSEDVSYQDETPLGFVVCPSGVTDCKAPST
jgi:hypothetical protein